MRTSDPTLAAPGTSARTAGVGSVPTSTRNGALVRPLTVTVTGPLRRPRHADGDGVGGPIARTGTPLEDDLDRVERGAEVVAAQHREGADRHAARQDSR
jgi:hypothetical protein